MAERVGFGLLPPPLDSVSCRFHNARVAVNASDAVAPCPLLPARMSNDIVRTLWFSADSRQWPTSMDVRAPHLEYRSYGWAELACVRVGNDVGAVYGSLRLETFLGIPTVPQPRQHEERQQPHYPEDERRAAGGAFCRSQQQHHREEQEEKQEHCFSESKYWPLCHRVLTSIDHSAAVIQRLTA